jgi:hypothetical protein
MRRMPLMRQRVALLAHIQNINSQYSLTEIGKKLAYKANRDGIAERLADPVVQQSIEVALLRLATTITCFVTWNCPVSKRPSSTRPTRAPCCGPSIIGDNAKRR